MTSLFFKTMLLNLFLFSAHQSPGQTLFTENFETRVLGGAWQVVTVNWHIADVQELRITPAENGRQYVLRSDSAGYIRLFVDIHDSIKSTRIKLHFSYYTYAQGQAPGIETEFYKKEMKDGLRGKLWKATLPVRGRWIDIDKIFPIPMGANSLRIVFFNPRSSGKGKAPCFDNVLISLLR